MTAIDTLTAKVEPHGGGTVDPFDPSRQWPHNAYRVTLRYQGRRMTIPFYSGIGNTEQPTAADVLECLLSDASSAANGETFEDWASEYGYPTNPWDDGYRQARRTYRAVLRQTARLRTLLGADFESAVFPDTHDQEESARRLTGQDS